MAKTKSAPATSPSGAPSEAAPTQAQIKAFKDLGQSAGSWLIQPDGTTYPGDEATASRLAEWLEAVKAAESNTAEESAS